MPLFSLALPTPQVLKAWVAYSSVEALPVYWTVSTPI